MVYDLAMIDGVVGQSDQRRSGRLDSPDCAGPEPRIPGAPWPCNTPSTRPSSHSYAPHSLLVLPTRGSLQELAVSFLKGNLEADLMALKEGGWFVDYWYCSICEAAIERFQREEESGNFREIV